MTDHDPVTVLGQRFADKELPPEGEQFARVVVMGTLAHKGEIDALIRRVAPEWPVEQIAGVDRAILRIATYEIVFGEETSPKIAINEAIELAKLFGSDSSRRFVNGALGALMAQLPTLPASVSAVRHEGKALAP